MSDILRQMVKLLTQFPLKINYLYVDFSKRKYFFNGILFFIKRHLMNLFQEGEKIKTIDIVEKCLRVKIKINRKFRADMHFEKITD